MEWKGSRVSRYIIKQLSTFNQYVYSISKKLWNSQWSTSEKDCLNFFDSKCTVRKYSNKDCHKNTVSRTFSCLKVKCSLYGFHRVVHWSPSCSIVDLWYLCKRTSITYQLSKIKELESELILRAYGITQYVMRCVPKWLLSGLKRYTCPEIRPENE